MHRLIAPVVLALALLVTGRAEARASAEYTYRYDQLWQATVRLLRVELGCQITDRDDDIGYVMFEYPGAAGRTHGGSAELVRSTDANGVERVRVTITISAMPSYVEHHVLTRLERKMREDFGLAPRVRAPHHDAPVEDPPEDGDAPDEGEPPSEDGPSIISG
jgi:hypothetical protein